MQDFFYNEFMCNSKKLMQILLKEKHKKLPDSLYKFIQIAFAYHSNKIEGCALSVEQVEQIFETFTVSGQDMRVDDITETSNHFKAFDAILDSADAALSAQYIKNLHAIAKAASIGTSVVGEYKQCENFVGNMRTALSSQVPRKIDRLISAYEKQISSRKLGSSAVDEQTARQKFVQIVDFHVQFERIHPFEDGNGRVGRLIMFKECLRQNIIPFIVDFEDRLYYYRGLREYDKNSGYLIDTCLSCQDNFKEIISNYLGE